MLQLGSRGSAVVALQKKLGITADGIFGPQTLAAVKRYQASHGLAVDGIVGPKTSAKLGLSSGGSGGGSAKSSGGSSSTKKNWEDTPEGQAAMYGWSRSVINSDPELKSIFNKATKENWTVDHFIAEVRDTKWFKKHSDTYRQAIILQRSDPATYKQRVAAAKSQLTDIANRIGAKLSTSQLNTLAEQSFWFGWDANQMQQHLSGNITASKTGYYSGEAGTAQRQFTEMAAQYGISVSPSLMASWVRGAAKGTVNLDGVKQYAIKEAMSRYPALADRLKAGETLMDIASPYINSYGQILEVNPSTVGLSDPKIQAALSAKDKDGKPTTQTVWEFENSLRADPRYMKTQQAQDKAMAVGHQVLRDFGLLGS